jgi:tetratricopeptide (TPR) repeat protein
MFGKSPRRSVLVERRRSLWRQLRLRLDALKDRITGPQKSVFFQKKEHRETRISSRSARLLRVMVWRAKRAIAYCHSRPPLWLVAGVYLGLLAGGVIWFGGGLFRHTTAPLTVKPVGVPPSNAQALLVEASRLVSDERYDEALAKLEKIRKVAPEEARVFQIEGAIFAARKDYPAARKSFEKAFSLHPSPAVGFNLAEVDFATGRYVQAEAMYRRLKPNWPGNRFLPFRIYLCCVMQKRPEDARAMADTLQPNTLNWFYVQAVEASQAGRKKEARQLLESARLLFTSETKRYDQTLRRLELLP